MFLPLILLRNFVKNIPPAEKTRSASTEVGEIIRRAEYSEGAIYLEQVVSKKCTSQCFPDSDCVVSTNGNVRAV